MADVDKSSKTEPPSEKKLQQALEEGNIAQSPETGAVFMLAAGAMIFQGMGEGLVSDMRNVAAQLLGNIGSIEVNQQMASEWLGSGFLAMLGIVAPILIACPLAGIIAGGLQTQFRVTPKAMKPKWSKVNPVKGFQRIYSMSSLVQFGIDFLKFSAFGVIVWAFCRGALEDPIFHSPVPMSHVGYFITTSIFGLLGRLILALAAIALLNYIWQRHKRWKDLMMSKQDIKDERKQQEGDPMVKMRRRQMSFTFMQRQMLQEVPTADVIVTNPTHFAVALKYEAGKDRAPVVLAKGRNLLALRIREIGAEHEVPTIENKPVARALFKLGAVGKPIPVELFEGVAAILSYAYRQHRYYFYRLKSRRQARAVATN